MRTKLILISGFILGMGLTWKVGSLILWRDAASVISSQEYQKMKSIVEGMPSAKILEILGLPSCVDSSGFKGGAIKACSRYDSLTDNNVAWVYSYENTLVSIYIEKKKVMQVAKFVKGNNLVGYRI